MASDRPGIATADPGPRKWRLLLFLAVLVIGTLGGRTPARGEEGADDPPSSEPAGMALDFYQRYLSSLRHTRCRFHPSCSAYARQAVERYGLFSGTARAADRLIRCNASAGKYYGRGPDGLLADPVTGDAFGRIVPRLEPWLLPAFPLAIPPLPAPGDLAGDRRDRILETVSFARQLAVGGDCTRAETEYLRAAHLARSTPWQIWSQFQTGACYFEAGVWADAERCYLQAGMLAEDDETRALARDLLAAGHFNAGRYASAAKVLHGPDPAPRALAVRGLAEAARGRWERAADDFAAGSAAAEDPLLSLRIDRLAAVEAAGPDLPRRSPGLAMFMSTVVPGTGQMYAGRAHDGLRHLIFNGILIFTVVQLVHDDHVPAAVGVGAIGIPFYVGNIRGARQAARTYNRDRRLELTVRAIEEAGGITP